MTKITKTNQYKTLTRLVRKLKAKARTLCPVRTVHREGKRETKIGEKEKPRIIQRSYTCMREGDKENKRVSYCPLTL